MKYDKFNDPVALLIDLCKPMNDTEKVMLGALGYKMSEYPEYREAYMKSLKCFYMKNFHGIKSTRYVLRSFTELNKELENMLDDNCKKFALAGEDTLSENNIQNDSPEKTTKTHLQTLRKILRQNKIKTAISDDLS